MPYLQDVSWSGSGNVPLDGPSGTDAELLAGPTAFLGAGCTPSCLLCAAKLAISCCRDTFGACIHDTAEASWVTAG